MKQKTRILIYILIAAAVVIIGAIAILSGGKTGDSVQNHLDLGRKYLEELSYDEAEMEFKEAIRIDPADPEPYIELADLYTKTDRAEMAVDILETGYRETEDENILQVLRELEAKPNNDNDSSDENFPAGSETGDGGDQSGNNSAAGGGNTGSGSANEELAEVPNLIGLSEEEAVSLCEEKGFLHSVSRQNSNDVKKGVVMEQTIPAGTMAAKGIGIPFAVSEGKVMVELPELSGLSEDEARKVCNDIGIGVNVSYESSNDVNEGFVISQNIPAGAMATEGASVKIVVSEGRKLEYDVELLSDMFFDNTKSDTIEYPYLCLHGHDDGRAMLAALDNDPRYDFSYEGEMYYSIEKQGSSIKLSERYYYISDFSEGLAYFRRDYNEKRREKNYIAGYLDENGNEVFSYTYADDSIVGSTGGGQSSDYQNLRNNLDMKNEYAAYHPCYDYYGFVDSKGNVIAEAKYTTVYSFTDGMAAVAIGESILNEKYGFIDTKGTLVIDCKYDTVAWGFENGKAIVGIKSQNFYKYGVIDKTGKKIVPCKFDKCIITDNGVIVVINSTELDSNGQVKFTADKYACYSSNGKLLLDMKYDYISSGQDEHRSDDGGYSRFYKYGELDGIIIAQDETGMLLLDLSGNVIANKNGYFFEIRNYEGTPGAVFFDPLGFMQLSNGEYIDKNGNIYQSHPYGIPQYSYIDRFDQYDDIYLFGYIDEDWNHCGYIYRIKKAK